MSPGRKKLKKLLFFNRKKGVFSTHWMGNCSLGKYDWDRIEQRISKDIFCKQKMTRLGTDCSINTADMTRAKYFLFQRVHMAHLLATYFNIVNKSFAFFWGAVKGLKDQKIES